MPTITPTATFSGSVSGVQEITDPAELDELSRKADETSAGVSRTDTEPPEAGAVTPTETVQGPKTQATPQPKIESDLSKIADRAQTEANRYAAAVQQRRKQTEDRLTAIEAQYGKLSDAERDIVLTKTYEENESLAFRETLLEKTKSRIDEVDAQIQAEMAKTKPSEETLDKANRLRWAAFISDLGGGLAAAISRSSKNPNEAMVQRLLNQAQQVVKDEVNRRNKTIKALRGKRAGILEDSEFAIKQNALQSARVKNDLAASTERLAMQRDDLQVRERLLMFSNALKDNAEKDVMQARMQGAKIATEAALKETAEERRQYQQAKQNEFRERSLTIQEGRFKKEQGSDVFLTEEFLTPMKGREPVKLSESVKKEYGTLLNRSLDVADSITRVQDKINEALSIQNIAERQQAVNMLILDDKEFANLGAALNDAEKKILMSSLGNAGDIVRITDAVKMLDVKKQAVFNRVQRRANSYGYNLGPRVYEVFRVDQEVAGARSLD